MNTNNLVIKTTFPPPWFNSLLWFSLLPLEWILIKSIVKNESKLSCLIIFNIFTESILSLFESRYFLTPKLHNAVLNNEKNLNKIENCLLVANVLFCLTKTKFNFNRTFFGILVGNVFEWYSKSLIRSPYDLLLIKGINVCIRTVSLNWFLL